MHQVALTDEAYSAFQEYADRLGISVAEYLNKTAAAPIEADGFSLTPEVRAGIEKGLADADAGRMVGLDAVRESIAEYKARLREERRR